MPTDLELMYEALSECGINREVCRRCYHTIQQGFYKAAHDTDNTERFFRRSWYGSDDGMVYCPEKGARHPFSLNPPKECPYKFEHGVVAGMVTS